MTKHFCDKCGKEIEVVWLVVFESLPTSPMAQRVATETMEVCDGCKKAVQEPYPRAAKEQA